MQTGAELGCVGLRVPESRAAPGDQRVAKLVLVDSCHRSKPSTLEKGSGCCCFTCVCSHAQVRLPAMGREELTQFSSSGSLLLLCTPCLGEYIFMQMCQVLLFCLLFCHSKLWFHNQVMCMQHTQLACSEALVTDFWNFHFAAHDLGKVSFMFFFLLHFKLQLFDTQDLTCQVEWLYSTEAAMSGSWRIQY